MTPLSVSAGDLTASHFNMLRQVKAVVAALPDGLTCHDVCQKVVQAIPGLEWVRGKFNGYDHSWLVIAGTRVIIDAYPWAAAEPIMLLAVTGSPWATLYRETTTCHSGV